jgi:AraC-like DNA-binding protein
MLLRFLLIDTLLRLESSALTDRPELQSPQWIAQIARAPLSDLAEMFVERVRAISVDPSGSHITPDDLADRAARLIERDFPQGQTVGELARRLDCHPKRLQQQFRSRHHTTIHRYLDRVRSAEALRLITREGIKVEAAALMVGLKSRKNLYQLVKRTTGLPLRDVRKSGAGACPRTPTGVTPL